MRCADFNSYNYASILQCRTEEGDEQMNSARCDRLITIDTSYYFHYFALGSLTERITKSFPYGTSIFLLICIFVLQ